MTSGTVQPQQRAPIFRGFDNALTRFLGADMRLIYGMAGPIFGIIALLIALAFYPHAWLVGLIVVCEVICLAIVVKAFMEMMDSEDETADQMLS